MSPSQEESPEVDQPGLAQFWVEARTNDGHWYSTRVQAASAADAAVALGDKIRAGTLDGVTVTREPRELQPGVPVIIEDVFVKRLAGTCRDDGHDFGPHPHDYAVVQVSQSGGKVTETHECLRCGMMRSTVKDGGTVVSRSWTYPKGYVKAPGEWA